MRSMILAACVVLSACSSNHAAVEPADAGDDAGFVGPLPPWLASAKIVVHGQGIDSFVDCRTKICRHNENTDLTVFKGAIYFVHRTAVSQTLGPDSALHIYRSTDSGATFTETAVIPAVNNRDLRDPHFYEVNGELYVKALTRLAVNSERDSNVDTIAVAMHSSDGATWSPLVPIAPATWSFWRIRAHAGTSYSAAYEDGDKSVALFSTTDGTTWTKGATIYAVSADTPLETELTFMPSGRLLALVRMDGIETEILGDAGRLRTKICWATAPYASFDCSTEITGQRLDGPLTFFVNGRLFVVARKHLQGAGKKRTSLFELTGNFEGGPLAIKEWGELPSAGDTSYAGVAMIDPTHALISWYSGDLVQDRPWVLGLFDATDIWHGVIDFSKL
jgi:hypothetical protein